MKPKKRQKLCYNCEADVDLEVIVCPFCAADLREEKPEQQRPAYNQTTSVKNFNTQQSLYPSQQAPMATVQEEKEEEAVLEEEPENSKTTFGGTILFALGSQLFLLGFLMCFFSKDGHLSLQWDARLWYIYIFASIPLLIFGYRFLNNGPKK